MDGQKDNKKPEQNELFTSEDLLGDDEEAIKKKLNEEVERRVKERDAMPQEVLTAVGEAKKSYAVFSDEDEVVRDAADSLLEKALRGMKDRSTEAVKKAAEDVSRKMAKLKVARDNAGSGAEPPSPSPVGGGSAAAAHVESDSPKTIEQAEALSSKIANTFRQ